MFNDIKDTIKRPFTEKLPLTTLAIYIVLFLIIAWVALDAMRVLSGWVKQGFDNI